MSEEVECIAGIQKVDDLFTIEALLEERTDIKERLMEISDDPKAIDEASYRLGEIDDTLEIYGHFH